MIAKLITVIAVEITRGKGVESDPVRHVTQYYTTSGRLLAEFDPVVSLNFDPPCLEGLGLWKEVA